MGVAPFRVRSRRCQASKVAGVTSRWERSRGGSTRVNADRLARPDQESRGRLTCRRSTATSCGNASSSAMTAALLRALWPHWGFSGASCRMGFLIVVWVQGRLVDGRRAV
jgi:hypothetical protein